MAFLVDALVLIPGHSFIQTLSSMGSGTHPSACSEHAIIAYEVEVDVVHDACTLHCMATHQGRVHL